MGFLSKMAAILILVAAQAIAAEKRFDVVGLPMAGNATNKDYAVAFNRLHKANIHNRAQLDAYRSSLQETRAERDMNLVCSRMLLKRNGEKYLDTSYRRTVKKGAPVRIDPSSEEVVQLPRCENVCVEEGKRAEKQEREDRQPRERVVEVAQVPLQFLPPPQEMGYNACGPQCQMTQSYMGVEAARAIRPPVSNFNQNIRIPVDVDVNVDQRVDQRQNVNTRVIVERPRRHPPRRPPPRIIVPAPVIPPSGVPEGPVIPPSGSPGEIQPPPIVGGPDLPGSDLPEGPVVPGSGG